MLFYEYDDRIQQWAKQVLDNREKNAELTLKYAGDMVEYGKKHEDHKLMGFGYYYMGETYYGLNDGNHFFSTMGKALSHLSMAEDWELVARCYNYLGIAAMNRGNAPVAMDYYLNGLNYCRTYHLADLSVLFQVNIAVLDIECGRYAEAQDYLEKSCSYMRTVPQSETYHSYIFCIYVNLVRCFVMQNKMERIDEILDELHTEHWAYGNTLEHLSVYCIETLYYHRTEQIQQRDACIAYVDEQMPENMTVLDIFDDFYDYCLILLDAGKDESFWHVIEVLEPLTKNFNILNLHLKIISLKLKYYRRNQNNAEYLQAAGLYYEMSELMETEMRDMMNMVLGLRKDLEWASSAREKAEKENRILQKKSELDQLTGLANRFRLNDYSDQVLTHAYENQLSLTVEILDIDYFKEFNDNYGHQAGDRCLRSVADVFRRLIGEHHAFCARYGGDEFVLIFEGITREQAIALASELKKRVMALEIEHKFSKALPIVTVSQGICWGIPKDGNRMWDFLHAADDMLYRVKRLSRNNYCVGDVNESEDIVMGHTREA